MGDTDWRASQIFFLFLPFLPQRGITWLYRLLFFRDGLKQC